MNIIFGIKKLSVLLLTVFIFSSLSQTAVFAVKTKITDEKTAFEFINIEYFKQYNDAYLTEYIVKAVNNNRNLKIQTLKKEEAVLTKNLVRAGEMPQIGIGAIPALYKLPGLTHTEGIISMPLYAGYEADIFGKNRDRTKSFDKSVEIAEQKEISAYISVTAAVTAAYYNIVKLDKLISVQENIVSDASEICRLMKLANEQGLVSVADTVVADKSLLQAQNDYTELIKTREKLLNLLCVLTGDSPENSQNLNRVSFDDINVENKIPDSVKSDIIFSRPDYVSAEKLVEKAGIDVRVAKKEFLPTFDIFGILSFNSTKYFSEFNFKNAFATAGVSTLLPLFTGGAKIANLKLKKNKYKQACENYENTVLTSVQEVNDALCDLKLDNEKYLNTVKKYNAERKDFYFSKLKYNEGVFSKLELLQKEEILLQSEKILVIDKISVITDKVGLYKATGAADI